MPEHKIDQAKEFIEELTKLSKMYKIIIGGCGCCRSPFLTSMENDNGEYILNYKSFDGLEWINNKNNDCK